MHSAFQRTDHRPWPLPHKRWSWRQSWCDLLFAHWPVPAESLSMLVPDAVRIQEFDGTSWVGVVPFRMEGVMMRPLPDMPGVSAFAELNLRLYVEVDGKPGVWFVSLDAENRLAVWGARRLFHLPYFHAAMSASRAGDCIEYSSERLGCDVPVTFRGRYRPTADPCYPKPGTLEHFLTERYCLYTCDRSGNLLRADVHHHPWPLQPAAAQIRENTVASSQGIPLPTTPPLVHFSKRLDVVVWSPQVLPA